MLKHHQTISNKTLLDYVPILLIFSISAFTLGVMILWFLSYHPNLVYPFQVEGILTRAAEELQALQEERKVLNDLYVDVYQLHDLVYAFCLTLLIFPESGPANC